VAAPRIRLGTDLHLRPRSYSRASGRGYGGSALERLSTHRAALADSALALLLFAAGVWELLAEPFADDVVGGPLALNLAAVALATLPLAARRAAPLAVVAVVSGAIAVRALVAEPLEIYPPVLAALVAAYSVAAYSTTLPAVAGAVLAVGAIEIAAARGSGGDATPDPLAAPVLLGAVWAVGRVAGSRHARARALERRAAERDRTRAEEARAAAATERRRIARELHDAVSHSLALIAMQAGGAESVLRRDPERAGQSLRSIERAAREGLTEMRRLLGLMGAGEPEPELSPQAGIERLGALIDGAREAGLAVSLESEGEARPVPPAVDLSAYRIVQEALTNAAKHAGRCRAQVFLRWRPSALELEVTNDGARRSDDEGGGAGRGLIGMRERATLLGGALEAGPQGDGHYRVFARLPLEPGG
jgi:signal transduction histidine kinase